MSAHRVLPSRVHVVVVVANRLWAALRGAELVWRDGAGRARFGRGSRAVRAQEL